MLSAIGPAEVVRAPEPEAREADLGPPAALPPAALPPAPDPAADPAGAPEDFPLTAVPDLLLRVPLKEDDPGRLPEGVRLPLPLPLGEALLPPLELEEWAEEEEPPCEELP